MSTDDKRQDDLDYLLSLRPPSAYEKWCVGKTDEEIEASHQKLVLEACETSARLRGYPPQRHRMSLDEQRNMGMHNSRTANDGPGDYVWDDYLGEDAQPVQD